MTVYLKMPLLFTPPPRRGRQGGGDFHPSLCPARAWRFVMKESYRFIRLSIIILGLSLLILPKAYAVEQRLIIIHTNDLHGHPLKFPHIGARKVGGLPAIADLVQEVRKRHKNVLVLDAGDLNTGTPESTFFKAAPDILALNYIGYDAMTLGNHEFDNPLEMLRTQQRLAAFPFISANIRTREGARLLSPYIIKVFEGIRIGIFGLTLKETETIGNPQQVRDLVFEDELRSAQDAVDQLKTKADIVIALVHLGIWNDNSRGSKRLASNVRGIDLIIDGHSHTDLKEPLYINGTPIVQAFKWGMKVGMGCMTIEQGKLKSFDWISVPVSSEPLPVPAKGCFATLLPAQLKDDSFLEEILSPFAEKVERSLSEVIGFAEGHFPIETSRSQESELGNLIADSMLWLARDLHPDFALHNGGGIRAPLPGGDITKKRIYEILPFDNTVVVIKLKGALVTRLFEHAASVSKGSGAFPQLSKGVRLRISSGAERSYQVTISGSPIDPDKIYSIATNSYLADGGDGYRMFLQALERYDTSILQRDALIEYITRVKKRPAPVLEKRIEIGLSDNLTSPLMKSDKPFPQNLHWAYMKITPALSAQIQ